MNIKKAGTASGCVVWIIAFGLLILCILPVAMIIGGLTSVSNFAMQTLGPVICPDGTTAESYSYATTTTDEFGNSQPSTAYELHCIDAAGTVVKEDPILYAFMWMGIIAALGLGIAALLAFGLAAPAGIVIGKLLNRNKQGNITTPIEPE